MMSLNKTAVALLALTGWLISGLAQTTAQPGHPKANVFSDAGKATLSRQMTDAVSRGDTPGVVALVVGRQGVLYEAAAGKLDVAQDIAMPANAIFAIASMTKPVTSVAIGSIFVELQPAFEPSLAKPFPLGAGHDKFGLGFQIASGDPQYARFRSPGSMSWAGIWNTEFWIDPVKHIGGVMMMQFLPFYDDTALRTLRDFEQLVYQNLH